MIQQLIDYVYNQLATNQFAQAGAITAGITSILAGSFVYLKSYPLQLYNYLDRRFRFTATIESDDPLYRHIDHYIATNFKHKFRRVEVESSVEYDGSEYPFKKIKTSSDLKLSHENDYVIFWKNYRRLVVTKVKEKLEAAHKTSDMFRKAYVFSGFFAKSTIINLLKQINEEGEKHEALLKISKKVVTLFNHTSFGNWAHSTPIDGKTFDDIFLTQKPQILSDLNDFLTKKELYQKLKVPFKRGYLFYGLPGNGKSSLAFAIANYLKYDIYSLNVSSLYKEEFFKTIQSIPSNSIVLVEDIDAYYNGREAAEENKISFSMFINALSGIEKKENILTIFTTNIIDNLDPALIRDGRCDLKLELLNPSQEVTQDFLFSIYNQQVDLTGYSPTKCFAQIQNIVLKNINDVEAAKQEILS